MHFSGLDTLLTIYVIINLLAPQRNTRHQALLQSKGSGSLNSRVFYKFNCSKLYVECTLKIDKETMSLTCACSSEHAGYE